MMECSVKKRWHRNYVFWTLLFAGICLYLLTAYSFRAPSPPGHEAPSPRFIAIQNTTPIILLWTTFFGHPEFQFGLGTKPFQENCNCTCMATTDKSKFSESSAVVIHPRDTILSLPKNRFPWQRFVLFLLESPMHTPSLHSLNGVINWTMTYRRDSDILVPSGLILRKNVSAQNMINYAAGKTKLVIIVNSNCNPPSKRQYYVKHLSEFIPVDYYGDCGIRRCPDECNIMREYKFYLSFENSICKDYLTEKTWFNAFARGLVPVVLGGANYSDMLPPHSFIDIADYNSPKELADYLKIVAANDSLYNEYFQWRMHNYVYVRESTIQFCDLCYKLHTDVKPKMYHDLQRWWSDGACLNPKEKYPTLARYFES